MRDAPPKAMDVIGEQWRLRLTEEREERFASSCAWGVRRMGRVRRGEAEVDG
jgi:hypothetical protein